MASSIKTLKDSAGNQIIPRTTSAAITMAGGALNLDEKIQALDGEIASLDATKANQAEIYTKTEVDTKDAALVAQLNDMTQDLSAQLEEKATVLDVVLNKTTLIAPAGKNIYNKDDVVKGGLISTSGDWIVNPTWVSSGYIVIKPNTSYVSRYLYNRFAWYDSNLNFISRDNLDAVASAVSPPNAKYVRFCMPMAQYDIHMMEEGNAFTSFEKYYIKVINAIDERKVEIVLPDKIYGIAGKELNVYFRNIIYTSDDIKNYSIDVACSAGTQYPEKWRTATSTPGEYPMTIKVLIDGYTVLASASSTIVIKSATVGNAVNKKVLVIGDSVTDGGVYTGEMINLFNSDPMDLTLLGTRGTAPNLHEGRSGWTVGHYALYASYGGLTNPFYNPATSAFDLSHYMGQQGYSSVDHVIFNLGINNVMAYLTDTPPSAPDQTAFDLMITSIKTYDPNIKIGISVIIPPGTQDGFATVYGSGFTYRKYWRNYYEYVKALITKFKERTGESIYLVPINVNLDTINGYPTETIAVNSRMAQTIVRQTDAIHPNATGKYQLSDSFYYYLKSFEV